MNLPEANHKLVVPSLGKGSERQVSGPKTRSALILSLVTARRTPHSLGVSSVVLGVF